MRNLSYLWYGNFRIRGRNKFKSFGREISMQNQDKDQENHQLHRITKAESWFRSGETHWGETFWFLWEIVWQMNTLVSSLVIWLSWVGGVVQNLPFSISWALSDLRWAFVWSCLSHRCGQSDQLAAGSCSLFSWKLTIKVTGSALTHKSLCHGKAFVPPAASQRCKIMFSHQIWFVKRIGLSGAQIWTHSPRRRLVLTDICAISVEFNSLEKGIKIFSRHFRNESVFLKLWIWKATLFSWTR